MAVVLEDVAKKASVSICTASLALRNKPRVSQATRLRVLRVAKELGFTVNASARNLVSGRSHTLGVALRNTWYVGTAYAGGIISGVVEISDKNDLAVMFARVRSLRNGEEPEYVRITKEGRVDGMIVIDQLVPARQLSAYANMNVPLVLIDRQISDKRVPSVCIDYRSAVHEATSYLIGLGHRRIAVLTANSQMFEFAEKLGGYRDALAEHQLGYDSEMVKGDHERPDDGSGSILERFKAMVGEFVKLREPPTAYMCFQDFRTAQIRDVLRLHHQHPEDVSIIGFESCGVEISPSFSISVIRVPVYELGRYACQLLVDSVIGHGGVKKAVLDAVFEPRGSCGPPA